MTKNEKYLTTVIYCYSPIPSCKSGLDEGLNFVFWTHIYKEFQ